MWGTADRLCPPSGSELVAANIGSEDLTVKRYEGLFHEIMNEPEREQVLDDLVAWLDGHLPARRPASAALGEHARPRRGGRAP